MIESFSASSQSMKVEEQPNLNPQSDPGRIFRKTLKIVSAIILISALVLGGYAWWLTRNASSTAESSKPKPLTAAEQMALLEKLRKTDPSVKPLSNQEIVKTLKALQSSSTPLSREEQLNILQSLR